MCKRFTCHGPWLRYAVLFFMVISAAAGSRAYAEEQKRACAEEIRQYCKGVRPGGGRLLICLKEHESDLSSFCREKVAEIEKQLMEAQQICAGDTEKFCKAVQPGEGRIARCLNEHLQEISPACREKVFGLKQQIPERKSEQ